MAPPRTRARRLLVSLGAALLTLALVAAPAGANLISPEAPHSPNADDINTLYWIGLVVMVALIVVVNGALLAAVFRYRERRGREPRQLHGARPVQVRAAGALATLALALFAVSVVFTENARDLAPTGPDGLQRSAAISGAPRRPLAPRHQPPARARTRSRSPPPPNSGCGATPTPTGPSPITGWSPRSTPPCS